MATGQFIVSRLKNLSPIEGADNIQQASLFGETVIIPKHHNEGDLGILFDIETQLSEEYTKYNNLHRDKTKNIDPEVSGYIEDNRRVRPIKLKGVKCSGLWMPIESLYKIPDIKPFELKEGEQHNVVGGVRVCEKYVTPETKKSIGSRTNQIKPSLVPLFKEHIDTDQYMRNLDKVKPGDSVIITTKVHGTSLRVGNLQVKKYKRFIPTFLTNFIEAKNPFNPDNYQYKEYEHVVGSRRVIKLIGEKSIHTPNRFHEEDIWTLAANKFLMGKLHKGETVYAEIVGFEPSGTPIMGSVSNTKLKPFLDSKEYKKFITKYGETTHFSYNCKPKEFNVLVYRITHTNEDGECFDLCWDQVKVRCEQLGVDHVPELFRAYIVGTDWGNLIKNIVEEKVSEEDNMFPEHLREGVVVRIEGNKRIPTFLRHKSFNFKVLENIIKNTDQIDKEETN